MSKLLVMFSGGIDSAGALYRGLTEYKDLKVYAHHINLINSENRDKAEKASCDKIVSTLRKVGFKFEYSESTINLDLPVWDAYIVWFTAGLIVQTHLDINYVTTGRNKTDRGPMSKPKPREMLKRLFETTYRHGKRRENLPCENLPVIAHMTKREVWDCMPKEIQDLTWSCRYPVYKDGFAFNCEHMRCDTCMSLQEWGINHERKLRL